MLYQTLAMLIFALTVHYLPLAIGPISASLRQVSPRVEEAARGLGRSPAEVFRTITAPLVRGGILAGVALVFLHAIKELPATLVLAPIGFRTLATEIWNQTQFGFYEASAMPALILLAVAAVPLYLLSERGTVAGSERDARPQPPLRLSGLRKHYGATRAVDGVELEVEPGSICALLGPSGCGKTTTLRLIAGLEQPDAGDDRDRRPGPLRPRRLRRRPRIGGSGWCSRTTPSSPTSTSPATSATGSAAAPTAAGSRRCSSWSASARSPTAPCTSSPAASSSGWPSPGRWRRPPT